MTGQLALAMLLWCCPAPAAGEPETPGMPVAGTATVAPVGVGVPVIGVPVIGVPVTTWSRAHVPETVAARPDAWVGEDKVQHLGLSFGATMFLYGAGRTALDPGPTQLAAAGGALTLGLAKELWDVRSGGAFSVRDLAWDVFGVGLGVLLTGRME